MIIGLDGNEANVKNRVGSGVYALNLLWQFSRIKDHEFIVFLKEKPLADLPEENANFKYQVFGPKKLWTRFALPVKLKFGPKIDLFFTLGHYGPRFSKIPYSITIFDLSYLHYPQMFNKNDLYQLTNWSKYSILKSKHIFTISNSSKEDIIKNYKIDRFKITVTYPGYDEKRFKPQAKSQVQKINNRFKIKGEYIIFVGTLQPRKNIQRLLEAFSLLIQNTKYKIQNTQLVVVGKKGWLYDSIFAKVKQLKLEDKIVFTDYVAGDDLSVLIAGAKVYVLPSLWEGFGIPVIEAQACGVPVVASNVSSLPEIIGDSGILVDPQSVKSIANGIKKVLTDEKLRDDLIQKGFKNIKRFSWQTCAKQTLGKLTRLASNSIP